MLIIIHFILCGSVTFLLSSALKRYFSPRHAYLISEFEVRVGLDQIPVAKAVLVDAEQQLNVILQIPVDIKVSYFHPARQLEPARIKALPVLIHQRVTFFPSIAS